MTAATQRIVIIGATSAMAEHCARLWVQTQPVHLTLVGRNQQRLTQIASDLKVRSPDSTIECLQTDFLNTQAILALASTLTEPAPVDIVLIAHGSLPQQFECQDDLTACRDALEINALSPVLFAEAFAHHMALANRGTLALIGSVAGDRGRRSNYVYGAAKGLVTRYAQGLQHRFADSGVHVVLIKPGPTDTPMTADLKGAGAKLANVEEVAKDIVAAIEQRKTVAYTPGKWALIMMVIRHLPNVIFKKMNI